jgi:hypothetical protein
MVNSALGYATNSQRLREKFDRSLEIDLKERAKIASTIKEQILKGWMDPMTAVTLQLRFTTDKKKMNSRTKLNSKSRLIKAWVVAKGGGKGWMRANTKVRASLEEVAAYIWNLKSRHGIVARSKNTAADIIETSEKRIVFREKEKIEIAAGKHLNRIATCELLLHIVNANTAFVVLTRSSIPDNSVMPSLKRANAVNNNITDIEVPSVFVQSQTITYKIQRGKEDTTKMSMDVTVDYGSKMGSKYVKKALESRCDDLLTSCRYFFELRMLGDFDKKDGRILGDLFMTPVAEEEGFRKKSDKFELRMKLITTNSLGLKELTRKYSWFPILISRIMSSRLVPVNPIKTSAVCLSDVEAGKIGDALPLSLATALSPPAGVDEWIGKYKALMDLDEEFEFFRPCMDTMAVRIVGEVGWGVKLRVAVGAFISW